MHDSKLAEPKDARAGNNHLATVKESVRGMARPILRLATSNVCSRIYAMQRDNCFFPSVCGQLLCLTRPGIMRMSMCMQKELKPGIRLRLQQSRSLPRRYCQHITRLHEEVAHALLACSRTPQDPGQGLRSVTEHTHTPENHQKHTCSLPPCAQRNYLANHRSDATISSYQLRRRVVGS